jgi:putative acetyltransferase
MSMETIRPERPEDVPAIRVVHEAAFPTRAEADLVERLRAQGKAAVALVAEDKGRIVGHILFSPVTLEPAAEIVGFALAPVAVLQDHEKHGVGRRLVQNGLAECHARGAGFVVVLGEPAYYGRLGFGPAARHGLRNEYDAGEEFMVFKLEAGALPPPGTLVKYAPEFARPAKPQGTRRKERGKKR